MCCATILVSPIATSAHAQELRGTVLEVPQGRPVSGSVVQVLDSAGTTISRTLTNSRGQFRAPLPARASRVRVSHVGYAPSTATLSSSRDSVTTITIRMALLRTMLATVNVRDNPNCSPRRDRVQALALWEQVRQGLLAMVVAREASPARLKVLRYQRFLEGLSNRITSQDVNIHYVSAATRPFVAVRTARDFVRSGFVVDSAGVNVYQAPDAESMIEDEFFFGYCFQIADRDRARPTQVGLSFSVPRRKAGRVDIEGTVWVDTASRELTTMDFRYVGLRRSEQRFSPGGRVAFRRTDNGSVLIDRWGLKLVALRYDTLRTRPGIEEVREWWELHEAGGELAHARWEDGSEWQASLGTLRVDAKTREGKPSIGTAVSLEYTDYKAVSDSTGEFELRDLLPGPYTLLVHDTLMAKIDVALRPKFSFEAARDSVHSAAVVIPSPLDYATQNCGEPKLLQTKSQWESASLFVRVVTPDGQPVKGLDFQVHALDDNKNPPLYSTQRIGPKTDREGRIWQCWTLAKGHYAAVFLAAPGVTPMRTIVPVDERVNVLKIVWDPPEDPQMPAAGTDSGRQTDLFRR